LCTFLKQMALLCQKIAIEIGQNGDYASAINLNDSAQNLFTEEALKKLIVKIKSLNKVFNRTPLNWDNIYPLFEDNPTNSARVNEWFTFNKSCANTPQIQSSARPLTPLLPNRDISKLDAELMRFRCLHDFCTTVSKELGDGQYLYNLTILKQYSIDQINKPFYDASLRLLVTLNVGYASSLWRISGSEAAEIVLSDAEKYAECIQDTTSRFAITCTVDIHTTRNLLKHFLIKSEYQLLQRQFTTLTAQLQRDKAHHFYCFNQPDFQQLAKLYTELVQLQRRVEEFKQCEAALRKDFPKLLFDITLARFTLGYELCTFRFYDESIILVTFEEVAETLKKLTTKDNLPKLPSEILSFKFVIESRQSARTNDIALALKLLNTAENHAVKYTNAIQIIEILNYKLLLISK
ncbi:MAG: hypothetical protein M3R00_10335, partial [Pseudomonadota bacterium]|nr:hypothetical protein [Pseudomonadota bacterium]